MNLTEVTDLTSIGTLFAFVLVCGGVLLLPREAATAGRFHLPYFNGKWIIPFITIIIFAGCIYFKPAAQVEMVLFKKLKERSTIYESLNTTDKTNLSNKANELFAGNKANMDADKYIKSLEDDKFNDAARAASITENKKYYTGWQGVVYNFPNYLFFILIVLISIYTFTRNYSIIPVLGLMSCFYLMTELGYTNWIRFLGWLVIGLIIYFSYGYKNSLLGKAAAQA